MHTRSDSNILSNEFNAPCLIFVTKLDHCILKNTEESITDVPELSCTHKEADPRLALHAIYTSQSDSVAEVSDLLVFQALTG